MSNNIIPNYCFRCGGIFTRPNQSGCYLYYYDKITGAAWCEPCYKAIYNYNPHLSSQGISGEQCKEVEDYLMDKYNVPKPVVRNRKFLLLEEI